MKSTNRKPSSFSTQIRSRWREATHRKPSANCWTTHSCRPRPYSCQRTIMVAMQAFCTSLSMRRNALYRLTRSSSHHTRRTTRPEDNRRPLNNGGSWERQPFHRHAEHHIWIQEKNPLRQVFSMIYFASIGSFARVGTSPCGTEHQGSPYLGRPDSGKEPRH